MFALLIALEVLVDVYSSQAAGGQDSSGTGRWPGDSTRNGPGGSEGKAGKGRAAVILSWREVLGSHFKSRGAGEPLFLMTP